MASILLLMYYGKKSAYSIPHLALRVEQNYLKNKNQKTYILPAIKMDRTKLRKNYG